MQTPPINRDILGGTAFLTAVYRGTSYCLSRDCEGGWVVSTRRIRPCRRPGGCKWFDTLADVRAQCKAFADLEILQAV